MFVVKADVEHRVPVSSAHHLARSDLVLLPFLLHVGLKYGVTRKLRPFPAV